MKRIVEVHRKPTLSFFGFLGFGLFVCVCFLKDHCTFFFHRSYTFYHLISNAGLLFMHIHLFTLLIAPFLMNVIWHCMILIHISTLVMLGIICIHLEKHVVDHLC